MDCVIALTGKRLCVNWAERAARLMDKGDGIAEKAKEAIFQSFFSHLKLCV